jgi:hypothetical membrane protein
MTQLTTAPDVTATSRTRALLACGVTAGPLFLVVAFAQVLTREGFDLSRHALSMLSLGAQGWVQIANFVVAGLLSIAFAVGIRRALHPGRGATWGPRLIGSYGVGLVGAGVFVADPALGFPPGTPDGIPDGYSWHAVAHGIAAPLAFLSLSLACFVFARRFAAHGQRGWAVYSVVTGVAAAVLGLWPSHDGASVRLAIGAALTFGWATALAARLTTEFNNRYEEMS